MTLNFCPACGQNTRDYRKGLGLVAREVVQETFDVDGKILRSLGMLLGRPGALSLAFSQNRRASFITPLRLYLFTSLLFFFTLSINWDGAVTQDTTVVTRVSLDTDSVTDQVIDPQQTARFRALVAPELRGEFDRIIDGPDGMARSVMTFLMSRADADLQAGKPPSVGQTFAINQALKSVTQPTQVLDEVYDKAPVALFFLLPVYGLLLKLFYFRQHKFYVEHLVFGIHIHAVAFLMFTLFMLLPENAVSSLIETGVLLLFMIYYFLALRRYYGQGRRKTFIKYTLLIISYGVMTLPAILLVMIVAVALL